ncbi:cytochrome P450 [Thozetella sp. PMI_491]|nr:cytochrome P450 [Thozetella sp. PMI_491]
MAAMPTFIEATSIAGGVIFVLYLLYYVLLPRPLPGIPYNKHATSTLLGDVPEILRRGRDEKHIFGWLASQTTKHRSPIVQVFVKPLSRPWVVITDPLESQDILLRRTKEFDRSRFFGELIGTVLPEQQNRLLTSDVRFKHNRNLVNPLMSPNFLNQVSGPAVYKSACALMKLWQVKCDLAMGRPFAADDITYCAVDSVLAIFFGLPSAESVINQRFNDLSGWNPETPKNPDELVPFPEAAMPEVFESVLTLANSVNTQVSPLPRLTSWVFRNLPRIKKLTAIKDQFISDKINEAVRDIESRGTDNTADLHTRSALYTVLLREKELAAKEARQPEFQKRAIADEFFGFLLAGYDMSGTTIDWGVRLLADHLPAQDRLRAELRAAMPQAAAENRTPTYQELNNVHCPYLDATVDEVLRHANTVAFLVRETTQDTSVLGCRIPEGTDVLLMTNGPGYLQPNLNIDGGAWSTGTRHQSDKGVTGVWNDDDIAAFSPERWLTIDPQTGKDLYNPIAGPTLSFGLGPRSCFGRKLALSALRIQLAMTIWHFELRDTPPQLSDYNMIKRFSTETTQAYVRLRSALARSDR